MTYMENWENRRNFDYQLKNSFNCTYGYQKLGEKQTLKEIREMGWLRTSTFIQTIYNSCWNARYDFKKW